MTKIYFNNDWEFTNEWFDGFDTSLNKYEKVRLPHAAKELPYNYTFSDDYQMICGYRKKFDYKQEWAGKRVFITFEGAAHFAEVFLNTQKIGENNCGYTAFTFELTDYLNIENKNIISVKLNSREDLNIPPFGNTIDYLTYAGIYRNVYLSIMESTCITDAYPMPVLEKGKWRVHNSIKVSNYNDDIIFYKLFGPDGNFVQEGAGKLDFDFYVENPRLWSVDDPNLYTIEYTLCSSTYTYKIGFRKAEFKADGFYLNGNKLKLRGLNRHQSYPYYGYAMPDSLQAYDAEILKNELGLNLVRTSHYPQSQAFLDKCDEIGLLVFTEIPGWQYIGDNDWKNVAIKNVERMVIQNRCHPSIILWGVRINESMDDNDFYTKTNRVAHHLDPSRQTGGVRFTTGSNLLEDVYTHNDFSFCGKNTPGLKTKLAAVKKPENMSKGYLVTEYMGHMFPTKSFDSEEHRLEHALRHAEVLQSAYHQNDISGCIGWCMFDYNTHKEFGSGDKICYHGVMDMFRNPKLAASVYASQSNNHPVLDIGASMEIGDHPASNLGDVWCFTNADSIKLYKNNKLVKEFFHSEYYKDMPCPPILVDDLIGDLITYEEEYNAAVAKEITACLSAVQTYGYDNLPLKYKRKLSKLKKTNNITFEKFNDLFNKYASNWGSSSVEWRFEAIKDNKVIKTVTKSPAKSIELQATVSKTKLIEGNSWDASLIRIVVLDNNGNICPYFSDTIELSTEGEIEIIGPKNISLRGGAGGTFVKTNGNDGTGKLTIKNDAVGCITIDFEITKKD